MLERCLEALLDLLRALVAARTFLVAAAILAAVGYALYRHPPLKAIARGDVGIRFNRLTGEVEEARDGSLLVIPGVHEVRLFSLRARVYRQAALARDERASPVAPCAGLAWC